MIYRDTKPGYTDAVFNIIQTLQARLIGIERGLLIWFDSDTESHKDGMREGAKPMYLLRWDNEGREPRAYGIQICTCHGLGESNGL